MNQEKKNTFNRKFTQKSDKEDKKQNFLCVFMNINKVTILRRDSLRQDFGSVYL